MKKFAHLVKTAEVRGVMAYLVDSELVKVASEEDFDALVKEVSDALGDQDYDLNTVLNKTAEIIEGASGQEEKTANEISPEEAERRMGQLTMSKMAGEISDEEFEKEAASLRGVIDTARAGGSRVADAGRAVGRGAQGAGRQVVRGGKAVGSGTATGARYVGRGAQGAGRQVARGGKAVGREAQRQGQAVREHPSTVGGAGLVGGGAGYGLARYLNNEEEQ